MIILREYYCLVLITLLGFSCSMGTKSLDVSDDIKLTLQHQEGHKFKLKVENIGLKNILIPRLTHENYQQNGAWGGYSFNARPVKRSTWIYVDYSVYTLPRHDEYVELAPGESYSTTVYLGELVRRNYSDFEEFYPERFSEVLGEFVVQADLTLINLRSVRYPRNTKIKSFGSVQSNLLPVYFK